MGGPTSPVEPIVFAVTRFLPEQRCTASIVSSHRTLDLAFWHTSWTVKSCTDRPRELVCQTIPFEHASYATGDSPERTPARDLIRLAGQSETEFQLSSLAEDDLLPLFLTTGRPEAVGRYAAKIRLLTRTWAENADFLADQAFWIRYYQQQVASGATYLKGRLTDYEREKRIASGIEISVGDTIPVNADLSGRQLRPGCLQLEESHGHGVFSCTLCVLGQQPLSRRPIRRVVRWKEDGAEKTSNCVVAEVLGFTPLSQG
jgi:hypothetical protein